MTEIMFLGRGTTHAGLHFALDTRGPSHGSHGQRLVLAVGLSSRTTHDHRQLRGDRGYHYGDIKGGQPLISLLSREISGWRTHGAVWHVCAEGSRHRKKARDLRQPESAAALD